MFKLEIILLEEEEEQLVIIVETRAHVPRGKDGSPSNKWIRVVDVVVEPAPRLRL